MTTLEALMLIRNSSLLLICLMVASPAAVRDNRTFNPTQPPGQRATYRMQDDANWRTLFADGSMNEEPATIVGELDTLATGHQADGSWSLRVTFTNFRVKSSEEDSDAADPQNSGMLITLDKNGNFLKLSARGDEPEEENTVSGAFVGGFICPAVVLFPTMMLPAKPVKVGETWPVDATYQITTGEEVETEFETLRGTGTLRSFSGQQGCIDIDFTSELTSMSPYSDSELREKCIGSISLTYDLRTARVVNSHSHTVTETIGWALSANDGAVKTVIDHDVTLTLIERR